MMSRFKQKLSIEILHYFPGNFLLTGFGPFLALIREHDFIKKLVFFYNSNIVMLRDFSLLKKIKRSGKERKEKQKTIIRIKKTTLPLNYKIFSV